MSLYIVLVLIAAFIQIAVIIILREDFFKTLIYAIPLILISQLLFLYSYSNAPKFILIWFITTALTSTLAFVTGYFLWKENISIYTIIGIILIITGIFLLKIK